jgi:hypothetical protein
MTILLSVCCLLAFAGCNELSEEDYTQGEDVIDAYFACLDNKDELGALSFMSDYFSEGYPVFGFDNQKSITPIQVERLSSEDLDEGIERYLKDGRGQVTNVKKGNILILRVTFDYEKFDRPMGLLTVAPTHGITR